MFVKIINQIQKSNLPRPLKSVLIAYASFANRDGTSIRPTEAAVGARASMSRSAVSRHTQTLVGKGLLVHDLDEHGIHQKYAYGETGVWAYVYHLDARKLADPALVEQWEEQQKAIVEKRRIAGAKNTKTKWARGVSGNPAGHSKLLHLEHSKLLQPPPQQIATNLPQQFALLGSTANCDTDLPLKSDPSQSADLSAGSPAVNQNQGKKEGKKEEAPFAPLTTPPSSAANLFPVDQASKETEEGDLAKPLGKESNQRDQMRAWQLVYLWYDHTKNKVGNDDRDKAFRLMEEVGWAHVTEMGKGKERSFLRCSYGMLCRRIDP